MIGQSTAVVDDRLTHTQPGTPTYLVAWSDNNAYVKPSGPTADSKFLNVLGSNSNTSEAFGVIDFNVQDDYQFKPANPLKTINSITLGLTNSPFSSSASGLLEVYLVTDASRLLTDSTLKYDTTATPEGLSNQRHVDSAGPDQLSLH